MHPFRLATAMAAAIVASPVVANEPPASLVGPQTFASPTIVGSGQVLKRFVDEVGLHANHDLAFARLRGGILDCAYGLVYLHLGTHGGRAAYATLLAASHTGAAVSRLTYYVQSDGVCTVNVVN